MSALIKYKLPDGSEILVEGVTGVDVVDTGGQLASTPPRGATSDEKFDTAIDRVVPALRSVSERLKEIAGPSEISIEVSLGFKAGAGVFLASAETNGAIKATLKWKPAGE
jgi:hypothetical protein